MVTGSTAAMLYGMPRVTHDIDLVLKLQESYSKRKMGYRVANKYDTK